MNKKFKMFLLTLVVAGSSLGSVYADVEEAPYEPPAGGYGCKPPLDNICIIIKNAAGKVLHKEQGVIKV